MTRPRLFLLFPGAIVLCAIEWMRDIHIQKTLAQRTNSCGLVAYFFFLHLPRRK